MDAPYPPEDSPCLDNYLFAWSNRETDNPLLDRQKWFKVLLRFYSPDDWTLEDGPYDGWQFHQDSEDEQEEAINENENVKPLITNTSTEWIVTKNAKLTKEIAASHSMMVK